MQRVMYIYVTSIPIRGVIAQSYSLCRHKMIMIHLLWFYLVCKGSLGIYQVAISTQITCLIIILNQYVFSTVILIKLIKKNVNNTIGVTRWQKWKKHKQTEIVSFELKFRHIGTPENWRFCLIFA